MNKKNIIRLLLCLFLLNVQTAVFSKDQKRPNFLICISDDQSYPHTSFNGDPVVKTPHFDRVAREGVAFTNMFCNAPSCAPSRGAMLTGRNIYELEEASILQGAFPAKFKTYQEILWQNGYYTGFVGKGSPGEWAILGREFCPGGIPYSVSVIKEKGKSKKISKKDYPTAFKNFLSDRKAGQPFSFIFATSDPHRPYDVGSGVRSGMDITKVKVPGFMPDTPGIRSDLCDYFYEIQKFDSDIGEMLKTLEDIGELDNTVVIITSDNGMPFPGGAKCTLYDMGTRMPFAVRYPPLIEPNRHVDDLATLAEICPTILEIAGIEPHDEISVKGLTNLLKSKDSGRIDPTREFIVTALEVHGSPNPKRMIRTHDYLYIINLNQDKTNAETSSKSISPSSKLMTDGQHYTLREYLTEFRNEPSVSKYAKRAFGKRPAEELYNCIEDPFHWNNLAETQPEKKQILHEKLIDYLKNTGDPRYTDAPVLFESYLYEPKWKDDDPKITKQRKKQILKNMKKEQKKRVQG